MIGYVGAVAFEDHTTVQTARCYRSDPDGTPCPRLLVFAAADGWGGGYALGWRADEAGPGFDGTAHREWACPVHAAAPAQGR